MLELNRCPVCGSQATARIGTNTINISDPPRTIQQAGSNAILSYVLRKQSQLVGTIACRTCTHVYLNPTFDAEELDRFYSAECEHETKKQYRISEKVSGLSWAEQHQIDPTEQAKLLREARLYRPSRLAEIIKLAHGNSSVRIGRICDIGGKSGELTAEFHHARRFVYDKDITKVDDPGVTALASMEQVGRNAPYDLLVLSHVLEHVPSPVEFLSQLRPLLSDGGSIYVEVPLEYCGARIKRRGIPIGAHVGYFTKASLLTSMGRSGFGRIMLARREIIPYGELRRPAIKVVAAAGPCNSAIRKLPASLELVIDSFLVLRARTFPPRFPGAQ